MLFKFTKEEEGVGSRGFGITLVFGNFILVMEILRLLGKNLIDKFCGC